MKQMRTDHQKRMATARRISRDANMLPLVSAIGHIQAWQIAAHVPPREARHVQEILHLWAGGPWPLSPRKRRALLVAAELLGIDPTSGKRLQPADASHDERH